jgi:hypothetical protein
VQQRLWGNNSRPVAQPQVHGFQGPWASSSPPNIPNIPKPLRHSELQHPALRDRG